MNTHSLSALAVLFAACLATTAVNAADAPKADPGKPTAAPQPAPAPKTAEPPHASTPAPVPAPKTAEPPHAPTPAPVPAPAPKTPEPPHPGTPAPAPAPKPAEPPHSPTPAPVPAPAPKPAQPPHAPTPAPVPVPPAPAPVSTGANTWDNWLNAKPVPTSFPAGVVFTHNTGDGATGNRVAYFVGRTDVTTTQGRLGEQHTASGAIRLSADLNTQQISGQMGGFTSGTAATAATLNGLGLTMAGSYDASGRITGTTAAQGQTLGKVTGTLTTTLAQGNWSLAKNDFSVNATFRAGRVNAPGH